MDTEKNQSSLNKSLKGAEYGITTGTGAAAAAKAALMSIHGEKKSVILITPLGKLEIDVEHSKKLTSTHGRASVVKRPYHDPDVTRNLEIFADVLLIDNPGIDDNGSDNQRITIKGGEGIGLVTKPGLQVPVGQPAINPVPQEMIRTNLQDLLPKGKGAEVVISVPGGEKLAEKTLNPRLGIKGGISILGTTGIARSMSLESYKKSFKCQLDVAVAEGYKELVFVPGNIGENIAQKILKVNEDQIIQMGNFAGYMLSEAAEMDVESILLLGHAGKLIKIAAGIFNTKHSIADGRREIITAHAALSGADQTTINDIFQANTTEEMMDILEKQDLLQKTFNSIAHSIKERCRDRYSGKLDVIIVKMDGTVLNDNHRILF